MPAARLPRVDDRKESSQRRQEVRTDGCQMDVRGGCRPVGRTIVYAYHATTLALAWALVELAEVLSLSRPFPSPAHRHTTDGRPTHHMRIDAGPCHLLRSIKVVFQIYVGIQQIQTAYIDL